MFELCAKTLSDIVEYNTLPTGIAQIFLPVLCERDLI